MSLILSVDFNFYFFDLTLAPDTDLSCCTGTSGGQLNSGVGAASGPAPGGGGGLNSLLLAGVSSAAPEHSPPPHHHHHHQHQQQQQQQCNSLLQQSPSSMHLMHQQSLSPCDDTAPMSASEEACHAASDMQDDSSGSWRCHSIASLRRRALEHSGGVAATTAYR
jgi:OAR motif